MSFLDSRFYSVVDRLSNLFILNIFWIVSCLPIVTIAPATSAMFSVVRQWKLNQDTSVVRNYFRYFKENFKQTFLIGLIWIGISILLFFNYFYLNQDQSNARIVMLIPLLIISLLFLATTVYLFPVITHFQVTWKNAIKSSFFISILNLPITFTILGVFVLLTVVLIYFPVASLIIFSLGAYLIFSLCYRVFQKMDQGL